VDAVRVTLQRHRPVAEMREQKRRDLKVVINDVELGDLTGVIKNLGRIGDRDAALADLQGFSVLHPNYFASRSNCERRALCLSNPAGGRDTNTKRRHLCGWRFAS